MSNNKRQNVFMRTVWTIGHIFGVYTIDEYLFLGRKIASMPNVGGINVYVKFEEKLEI